MNREPQREHIPTIASAYGAFLNALHDPPRPVDANLPVASIRGGWSWRRAVRIAAAVAAGLTLLRLAASL